MVNKSTLLDQKTLSLLQKSCKRIEKTRDRSFLIVGLYSITIESIVPVS